MGVVKTQRKAFGGLVAAFVLGAVTLAGCGSGGNPPAASGKTTTTTTTTSTSASTTSSTGSTTQTTAASSTSTTSGAAQNLAATAALKSELTAVYVAKNSLPASQVAGTAPNSVYYAYEPSTKTYWAIASFVPNSSATMQTQVAMQDDGCCGIFSTQTLTSWSLVARYLGAPCPGQIPADLMTLWNLQSPGDCA